MESADDFKGKLSLIKKRRDQKSFQASSAASVLLTTSLEQDPLEHRTAEEIAVPRERSTNRGAVAEEKRNMDQNSNGTTTGDQKRKKMEDLRESCNSTKNNGGGIGFKTLNDQPSEMVVATSATRRPSKEFNQRKNDSKETAPSANSKLAIQWTCDECHHTCIPVRSESRCLCGHRYKEHKFNNQTQRSQCQSKSCPCQHFYFIVAEGAWILRCRCKHKHIEHDPGRPPFLCKKTGCRCQGFDSPWVCNCGHPWANHTQSTIQQSQKPLILLAEGEDLKGMEEVISNAMAGNSMNDIQSDMMYRRDGEL